MVAAVRLKRSLFVLKCTEAAMLAQAEVCTSVHLNNCTGYLCVHGPRSTSRLP